MKWAKWNDLHVSSCHVKCIDDLGSCISDVLCTYFLEFFQFLPYSIELQSLALHFNQKPSNMAKRIKENLFVNPKPMFGVGTRLADPILVFTLCVYLLKKLNEQRGAKPNMPTFVPKPHLFRQNVFQNNDLIWFGVRGSSATHYY